MLLSLTKTELGAVHIVGMHGGGREGPVQYVHRGERGQDRCKYIASLSRNACMLRGIKGENNTVHVTLKVLFWVSHFKINTYQTSVTHFT